MYDLMRKALFMLTPETAHDVSLQGLGALERMHASQWLGRKIDPLPTRVMGIDFPNPVGLAAGLDKNGEYIRGLSALGFGSIEVGTVTPRPQPGNPKPRLFRLPEAQAIINRMGFNNKGVDYLVDQVQQAKFDGVLGINIGKNKDTSAEDAVDDYLHCLNKVYAHASYVAVNLSSPNTPGLRDLQFGDMLTSLLAALKEQQIQLSQQHGRYVPLAVKVAPDMNEDEIGQVAEALIQQNIDGVIATNTTVSRETVEGLEHAEEQGGLSGAPLFDDSTAKMEMLKNALDGKMPVIGVGGIVDGKDAATKVQAGAELVQVYTGFIYRGPSLIKECVEAIRRI